MPNMLRLRLRTTTLPDASKYTHTFKYRFYWLNEQFLLWALIAAELLELPTRSECSYLHIYIRTYVYVSYTCARRRRASDVAWSFIVVAAGYHAPN